MYETKLMSEQNPLVPSHRMVSNRNTKPRRNEDEIVEIATRLFLK